MGHGRHPSGPGGGPPPAGDRAAAVFTVLMVSTVLLGLSLAALGLAAAHRDVSRTEMRSLQALYAAEAGIQVALSELSASLQWPGYIPARGIGRLPGVAEKLEGARIKEIVLTPYGETLRVEARGEAGGLSRQVAAWLQKPAWAFALVLGQAKAPVSITEEACLRGTLIFASNVTIGSAVQVGDAQAKGGWVISAGNVTNLGAVYGGIRARGKVDNRGSVAGVTEQGVEVFLPPVHPVLDYYSSHADEVLTTKGKAIELGTDALQGFVETGKHIVYIDGNLVLDERQGEIVYRGPIALAASGSVEVRTGVVRASGTPDCALVLVAGKNIELAAQEVEALLWAQDRLCLSGSLTGAAVGTNLEVDGPFELTYDPELINALWRSPLLPPSELGLKTVCWWAKGL